MNKYLPSISDTYSRGLSWLGILLIPIILGVQKNGEFLVIWSIILLLTPVLNFGFTKAFLRLGVDSTIDGIISLSVFLLPFQIGLAVLILYLFFNDLLVSSDVSLILIALIIALRVGRLNIISGWLALDLKSRYTVDQILMSTISFALLYYFVIEQNNLRNWIEFALLQHIIYFTYISYGRIRFKFRARDMIIEYIEFSWPFYIASSIGILSSTFDKIYMARLFDVSEIGRLGYLQSLTALIAFISSPLLVYFEPQIYRIKENNQLVKKFLGVGLGLSLILAMGLNALCFFFIEDYTDLNYDLIKLPLFLLSFVPVFNTVFLSYSVSSAKNRRSKNVIIPSLLLPMVVVTLNLYMTPLYGILGASIALFIGGFTQALYCIIKLSYARE